MPSMNNVQKQMLVDLLKDLKYQCDQSSCDEYAIEVTEENKKIVKELADKQESTADKKLDTSRSFVIDYFIGLLE